MTVLKYELASSVQGPVAAQQDWWTLCYDTEIKAFFVDHEWGRSDPLNPTKQLCSGIRRYSNAAAWRGPGVQKLSNGMAKLRARASRT